MYTVTHKMRNHMRFHCTISLLLCASAIAEATTSTTTLRDLWTERGWQLPEQTTSQEAMSAVTKTLGVRRHVVADPGKWSKITASFRALYSKTVNVTHSKCNVYDHEHLDQNLRQSMRFECERGLAALKGYSIEDCLSRLDLVDQRIAGNALQECLGADQLSALDEHDLSPNSGISHGLVEQRLSAVKRTQRAISRTLQVLLGLFTGYVAVILYMLGTIVSIVTLTQMGLAFLNPLGALLVFLVHGTHFGVHAAQRT